MTAAVLAAAAPPPPPESGPPPSLTRTKLRPMVRLCCCTSPSARYCSLPTRRCRGLSSATMLMATAVCLSASSKHSVMSSSLPVPTHQRRRHQPTPLATHPPRRPLAVVVVVVAGSSLRQMQQQGRMRSRVGPEALRLLLHRHRQLQSTNGAWRLSNPACLPLLSGAGLGKALY